MPKVLPLFITLYLSCISLSVSWAGAYILNRRAESRRFSLDLGRPREVATWSTSKVLCVLADGLLSASAVCALRSSGAHTNDSRLLVLSGVGTARVVALLALSSISLACLQAWWNFVSLVSLTQIYILPACRLGGISFHM